ncbi:hypothetical protein [Neptuniibacter halophilus]|uniref:hypothetical protein n=1 Tax=Neptuniibacter halophilus TaxID=651666 RepID=UPI002572C7BB|nr:hypothetical protein [Neptuniibacter halophilus]
MSNQLEYYFSIESDLEYCARYVEFSETNFDTFSIEFARIIMAASAEIDTLAKELCKLIDSDSKANNISKYAECIQSKYPNICGVSLAIPRYGIKTQPWKDWSKNQSPNWWKSYNSIKHDRANEFHKASLKNAIDTLAGLLSITLYYLKEKNGKLLDISAFHAPRLLVFEDNTANGGLENGRIDWQYCLP